MRRLIAFRLASDVNSTAHPHADALRPVLEHARRRHGILFLQGGDDRVDVEAKRRNLAGRKFEINHFILRAENVDFADIGNGQYLGTNIFDVIPQLALA